MSTDLSVRDQPQTSTYATKNAAYHITDEEWFLERVMFEQSGCWSWTGVHAWNGYAIFRRRGRPAVVAHRMAFEMAGRTIPEGTEIDHLCRNRGCINPDHLEAVTHQENVLRGIAPSATNAVKTHCKHGHEFTIANTYIRPSGRQCRECQRANDRRYKERQAA